MSGTGRYRVVIVGAGSAGITVAARLLRAEKSLRGSLAVLDPADKHYYQPLWTLVGGGVAKKEATEREMRTLIPRGAVWIKDAAAAVQPGKKELTTREGRRICYEYLVVAAGLEIRWDGILGLREALRTDGVCSNYSYDFVGKTWECIRSFRGGTAIFTHPNTPVKCGGAPQKIMYLADDCFRRSGVRDQAEIVFASANAAIFQVKKYADTLETVIARKQITTAYRRNLIEIRPLTREAVFEHLDTGEREVMRYDMLHVTPPMGPPAFLRESPLADADGWADVDKHTLQHKRYPNVFALGDCSNLPTSKTGAAIRKQAPVAVQNLLALMRGAPLAARYDGYTSCPLVTGYNKLVLAEFDYTLTPRETFQFDQAKERWSMYVLKKDLLPVMYWNGMLKGRM